MTTPLLGGLSPARFLREIWHKRPLLIRNAIPGFAGLLSPAEMRQLACRDDVESRLIQGSGSDWQLDHGPFRKSDFRRLPETEWTLLVQSLNHFLPEADALLARFDFIPHARLDDLMASYAVPGGSVGPHFDSYDVFLLQGQGHRRWQIGTQSDLALLDDAPLKILRRFKAEDEWVLGPGDMLYLPPRYAHHGVATDDCLTYSIGFRAPAQRELVTGFAEFLAARLPAAARYGDAGMAPVQKKGEIDAAALERVRALLAPVLQAGDNALAVWFGQYVTEPKNPELAELLYDPPTDDSAALRARLAAGTPLERAAVSRLAFIAEDERLLFFWDGHCRILPNEARATVETLCEGYRYAPRVSQALARDDALFALAHALFQSGCLGFEADDDDGLNG